MTVNPDAKELAREVGFELQADAAESECPRLGLHPAEAPVGHRRREDAEPRSPSAQDGQRQRPAVNRARTEDTDVLPVRTRMEHQPPAGLDRRDDRSAGVDRPSLAPLRGLNARGRREVQEHGGECEEGSHDEEIGNRDSSF